MTITEGTYFLLRGLHPTLKFDFQIAEGLTPCYLSAYKYDHLIIIFRWRATSETFNC
jgi:hypothetical protein